MTTGIVAPLGCPRRGCPLSRSSTKTVLPGAARCLRSGPGDRARGPGRELVAGHRAGEEVALGDLDPGALERVGLLAELDALGNRLEPERLADEEHGARDVVGAGRR